MKITYFTLSVIIAFACSLLSACHPNEYSITKEQVLEQQKHYGGELVTIQGADGPYKDGGEMCGNYNTAVVFREMDQTLSYPATPGIAFNMQAYINAEGKALVVVRKCGKVGATSAATASP